MSRPFGLSRRRLLAGSALAGLALALAPNLPALAAPPPVKPGSVAPPFTLTSAGGGKISLADFKGKTVVLEWTNHECPFVRKHYASGNMQSLQRDAAKAGVVWLSIISSAPGEQGAVSPDVARQLTTSRDAAPAQVLFDPDGKVGRAYGARATPHMYVITPDGKLAYMGAIDDKPGANVSEIAGARNYVREALTALSSGKPVSPPQTRAYGCSIKYAS